MSSTETAVTDPAPASLETKPEDDAEVSGEVEASEASDLTTTSRVRDAIVTRGRSVANAAITGARGSLREAERRLGEEERRWDAQAQQATLPKIRGKDPIDDLAVRIDREADYWRTFAVRGLRPGAARNLAVAGGVIALAAGLALGALGIVSVAFGGDGPGIAALFTAGGVSLSACVSCALGILSERGRVTSAREALARADQAERRLERVAAILALRSGSPTKYVEALSRLERER